MIGLIAGFLVKRSLAKGGAMTLTHGRRLAKVGLVIGAVIALVVGFLIWDHFDDKAAIRAHDAERIEAGLEAEQRATANDGTRREARDLANDQSEQNMEDAEHADPEAAIAPAGRVSRAAADRLRND